MLYSLVRRLFTVLVAKFNFDTFCLSKVNKRTKCNRSQFSNSYQVPSNTIWTIWEAKHFAANIHLAYGVQRWTCGQAMFFNEQILSTPGQSCAYNEIRQPMAVVANKTRPRRNLQLFKKMLYVSLTSVVSWLLSCIANVRPSHRIEIHKKVFYLKFSSHEHCLWKLVPSYINRYPAIKLTFSWNLAFLSWFIRWWNDYFSIHFNLCLILLSTFIRTFIIKDLVRDVKLVWGFCGNFTRPILS
jgi:hypothetical protein